MPKAHGRRSSPTSFLSESTSINEAERDTILLGRFADSNFKIARVFVCEACLHTEDHVEAVSANSAAARLGYAADLRPLEIHFGTHFCGPRPSFFFIERPSAPVYDPTNLSCFETTAPPFFRWEGALRLPGAVEICADARHVFLVEPLR